MLSSSLCTELSGAMRLPPQRGAAGLSQIDFELIAAKDPLFVGRLLIARPLLLFLRRTRLDFLRNCTVTISEYF